MIDIASCNANPDWNKLYNATLVVPIQANASGNKQKKEMKVLGFICSDNMNGNFANKEVKDFLSSIGDLLFNLFFLYDRFAFLTKEEEFSRNEKLQQYDYWDDNR